MDSSKTIWYEIWEYFKSNLKISFQPVSYSKGEEEYKCHDQKENRKTKPFSGQVLINSFCRGCLLGFIDKYFINNFFNKVIFLINNILFIASVYNLFHSGKWILIQNIFIHFQIFDGVPTHIIHFRISCGDQSNQCVDFIFYKVGIDHGIFWVMIMPVFRMHSFVMMNKRSLAGIFTVMGNGMQQNGKSCLFSCWYRDCWNSKHFREAVQVNFHAAALYNIHHVQSQYNGFSKFDQLKGQIEITFQTGSVNDIYNDINFITHDTFSRYSLFHCIRSQTVDSRKVNETELLIFIGREAFFLFHCDTGPVSYL